MVRCCALFAEQVAAGPQAKDLQAKHGHMLRPPCSAGPEGSHSMRLSCLLLTASNSGMSVREG